MSQNLELVEKLVNKTGLSYTEARNALERANGDILEALIQLEAEGRVSGGKTAQYSTNASNNESTENKEFRNSKECKGQKEKSKAGENFKKTTKSIGEWLKDVFDKGNTNNIEMFRNGEKKIGMPVTAFVLLLIFCFWIIIPLMIVGLFLGCRYHFSGPQLGKQSVNNAMDKATDLADNIKSEIMNTAKDNNGNC